MLHYSDCTSDTVIPFLARLFTDQGGQEYLGEPVTMAEHMLQAAQLAEDEQADDSLVAAALLHDVGHFTTPHGHYRPDDTEDRYHEDAGADFLEAFFPPVVVTAARLHVDAKRYLTATDDDYAAGLSEASLHSLKLQGGPMSEAEQRDFMARPFASEALRVRRWDDLAKIPGTPTRQFNDYIPMLEQLVRSHAAEH